MLNRLAGIGLLLVPLYMWWQLWRTQNWPTARARVIEVEPQTLFERQGNTFYLNRDSDYAIEYEVDGQKYIQKANIEANVRVSGFKIWRAPMISEEFQVRYCPSDPSSYSLLHMWPSWQLWVATVACFVFGWLLLTTGD